MATEAQTPEQLYLPGWPLATCRELAVHLGQLGTDARVLLRSSPVFDAHLDQVECIEFICPAGDRELVADILEYYLARYRETPDTRSDTPQLVRGDRCYALTPEVSLRQLLCAP